MARRLCGRPTHDGTPCRNPAGCSVNHGTQPPSSDSVAASKQAALAASRQSSHAADAAGSPRRPPSTTREAQTLLGRLPEGPAGAAHRLAHEQAKIFGEWPDVNVRSRHIRTGPRKHIDRTLDGFTVFVRDHRGEYKATVATTISDGKERERAAAGREWKKQQATHSGGSGGGGDRCICGGEFVPGDDGPDWVCGLCGRREIETYPERT